jgi:hypothetical protein
MTKQSKPKQPRTYSVRYREVAFHRVVLLARDKRHAIRLAQQLCDGAPIEAYETITSALDGWRAEREYGPKG